MGVAMHSSDPDIRWRKSSRSNGGVNGDCVEVADLGTATAIRDSKNPTGPTLTIPARPWQRFLTMSGAR
jgi:hypothetical protein